MATQTFTHTDRATLLRRTLQADSAVSLLTGLLFIVDAAPIASFSGLPWPGALEAIGVGLLGYAALMFLAARHEPIDRRLARGFVIADCSWVAASALILLAGWPSLTTAGFWAVLALADVGAVFAALKYLGLRRLA
jgi:hypothetical protein